MRYAKMFVPLREAALLDVGRIHSSEGQHGIKMRGVRGMVLFLLDNM